MDTGNDARERLGTDGLGGFASGTVSGVRTLGELLRLERVVLADAAPAAGARPARRRTSLRPRLAPGA